MSHHECSEPQCVEAAGSVELLIHSKSKDIGDFEVRRLLPALERKRVGPFIFFDHMGPATFAPGQGMAVRPHPHIGLATVTYLFEGIIQHRDSLGFDQAITPGAVNWMTAGRGIVHSERTPEALRSAGSSLHGLQVWLALPRDAQEIEPSFVHHPADTLPRIVAPGLNLALIAGSAYGQTSPVETASPTFYLAGGLAAGTDLEPPGEHEERALYVVSGRVEIDGESVGAGSMAVLRNGSSPKLHASEDSQLALLGGAPLDGERHLWWNFVSTSKERIEQAKADWEGGRFPVVPGDTESIPLPKS